MDNFFRNINLIDTVFRWKYFILLLFAASVVLSAVFSGPYFIKPKYRSVGVLYPSNLIPYSSETPTEQMLQIFKSDDLREGIISKFNLTKHYRIDTTKSYYKSALKKKFDNNVTIKKNEFEAVVIEVLDENPEIASQMVTTMIELFNIKARELQRAKTSEVVVIWERQLFEKEKQIDSIERELSVLREQYGLLDYKVQAKEASKQVFKTGTGQNSELFKNLKEKGGNLFLLSELLKSATKDLSKIRSEYEQAISDLYKELTYTNLVSSPVPADKKAYPIRWLIVVASAFGSIMLSLLLITMIERNIKYKAQKNVEQENS